MAPHKSVPVRFPCPFFRAASRCQLADVGTYVIGRYIRRHDGMTAVVADAGEEALNPFDRLVAETVGRLTGRLHLLLSQPVLHGLAA